MTETIKLIIAIATFLITIGSLVWKLAIMCSIINKNKDDIMELKKLNALTSQVNINTSEIKKLQKIPTDIDNHTKDIDSNIKDIIEIKAKQSTTDTILTSMSNTLSAINAKVDLLISGKVVIKSDNS